MKSTLTALITILALAATTGCTKDDSDNLGDGLGSHSEDFNVNYTIKQSRSSKRGICGDLALPQFDIPTIAEGVGWYYNWSSNCPSATMLALLPKYDMTFLPMAWNNNYNAAAIRSYKEAQPEAQFLLAYNEPNLTDQANMTPAQAAEKWGDLVALAEATARRLGMESARVLPTMLGEDFAFYQKKIPGLFITYGMEGAPLHHPSFAADPDYLDQASRLLAGLAADWLEGQAK